MHPDTIFHNFEPFWTDIVYAHIPYNVYCIIHTTNAQICPNMGFFQIKTQLSQSILQKKYFFCFWGTLRTTQDSILSDFEAFLARLKSKYWTV